MALPGIQYQTGTTNLGGGGTDVNVNPSSVGVATIPSTVNSTALAPQTPIQVPIQPPVSTGASLNASIPTPQSIIDQSTTPTTTDNTQSSTLQRIADLVGNDTSLATKQTQAETAAGISDYTKTVNDLTTHLQGLNDQATALQNEAQYTIPNAAQVNGAGSGATVGGIAPITASQLRMNQIKQGAIATQSLTVKSALYAAQGQYSLAKDAADKAAQVAFDAQNQEIAHQKALLDTIAPQLNKEQTARATLLQTQLADRKTQIDNQQSDFKTGQALAISAMKNNPTDATAQFNAQQALKLDPTSPTYLQDVAKLVGQYQDNATQTALDNKLKEAQISKIYSDINATSPGGGNAVTTVQDNQGNNISVPVSVAPYYSTSNSGIGYADLSTVQGTAKEKAAVVATAQAAGIKVITNKNTALDLVNIGDANSKLDSIGTIMAGIDQPSALSRDLAGFGLTKLAVLAQTNPQQAAAGALQGVGLDILKAISGVQGFRGNTSVVQQITDHLPSIYDTNAVVQTKIGYIRQLINDRENSILGKQGNNTNVSEPKDTSKGTVWNRPDGKYISDGTQWVKQ